MSTASVFLALNITSAEIATAAAADAAAQMVGPDCQGLLVSAQQDCLAARKKLAQVTAIIGAGTEKTAIDNMITALT